MRARRARFGRMILAAAAGLSLGGSAVSQEGAPAGGKPAVDSKTEDDAMRKPKVGEPAPDFRLKDHGGSETTLSRFKGKQNVLLAFFPKAFTGG
jgi:cytochrome oxidase Cu insertion factor (SCO1/SenC/PrrC family)